MNEIKLKPCPFCGGGYQIVSNFSGICWGICLDCGMLTPQFKTNEDVIEFINTRKPMERIVEQLQELNNPKHVLKRVGVGNTYDYMSGVIDSIEIVEKGGAE